MNKYQYNQLNVKLFFAYCDAIKNKDTEFAKILMIDEKVVNLFEVLRHTEEAINFNGIFNAIKDFYPQPKIIIPQDSSLVDRARLFAISSHRSINQLYDGTSYEYHLYRTVQIFHRFKHLIPKQDWDTVEAACWLHDCVEDVKRNFSEIKTLTNQKVAAISCALSTNSHGHNRKARADESYYKRIRETEYAIFVKLCDRIANMENEGDQLEMYKKEMTSFLNSLSESEEFNKYAPMIDTLLEMAK